MHLLQFIITAAERVRENHASLVVESVQTILILIRIGEDQLVEGSRGGILLVILVKNRANRMLGLLLILLPLLIVEPVEKDQILLRRLNSLSLNRGTTAIVMKEAEVARGTCLAHF